MTSPWILRTLALTRALSRHGGGISFLVRRGFVADRLGRNAILIELNPAYVEMAERRIRSDAPLLCEVGP